jgi:hypothetical protein
MTSLVSLGDQSIARLGASLLGEMADHLQLLLEPVLTATI